MHDPFANIMNSTARAAIPLKGTRRHPVYVDRSENEWALEEQPIKNLLP